MTLVASDKKLADLVKYGRMSLVAKVILGPDKGSKVMNE